MLPYLFPEITDVIIDHLHNDKSSLAACGLTHRAWLPSSRYHLFSDVTLSVNNVHSFDQLLNNPSNNIASVVQHLTITPCPGHGTPVDEKRRAQSAAVLRILPHLTTHLRMVKSLALRDLDWTSCSTEASQNILSNLGGVEALKLSSLGVHEAVDIICAFPLLRSLSLEAVRTNEADDQVLHLSNPPTAKYRRRPLFNINVIELHSSLPSMFRDWLLSPIPNIHTVRCNLYTVRYNPSVLLARAGASIQEIEISCFHGYDSLDSMHESLIDITKCTSLRSIHFHSISLGPPQLYGHNHQLYISPVLAQVSSPSFEELTFRINYVFPIGGRSSIDWSCVADALLRPRFRNLKRVCILWPKSDAPYAESFLRPFSPLSERGLVQLTFCDFWYA